MDEFSFANVLFNLKNSLNSLMEDFIVNWIDFEKNLISNFLDVLDFSIFSDVQFTIKLINSIKKASISELSISTLLNECRVDFNSS